MLWRDSVQERACSRSLCLVAADERSEAGSGCEAVAKSDTTLCQLNWVHRFHGRFAAGRSLAPLVSCYTASASAASCVFKLLACSSSRV